MVVMVVTVVIVVVIVVVVVVVLAVVIVVVVVVVMLVEMVMLVAMLVIVMTLMMVHMHDASMPSSGAHPLPRLRSASALSSQQLSTVYKTHNSAEQAPCWGA